MNNKYAENMRKLQTELEKLTVALGAEDYTEAVNIIQRIASLRKTNPDIVGTTLYAIGTFFMGLPNPAAALIGGACLTAAKIRSAVKIATKLR
ncbi:hypothetical protein ES703_107891 [subsurface metagenome]